MSAHAGSRARVTSMGGLYDTAALHAPICIVSCTVIIVLLELPMAHKGPIILTAAITLKQYSPWASLAGA